MGKREQYLTELNGIAAANNGLLRAEDVVEFAKDPRTALHECFTWDDTVAAYNYRITQARALIRVVVTVIPQAEGKFRAFVSLKEDRYNLPGGGYRVFLDTMTDGNLRQRLLVTAMEEMDAFMRKYEMLKELAGVFAEMEKITATPRRRKRKLQPQATA